MNFSNNSGRYGRLAVAALLAGTFALVPVQANAQPAPAVSPASAVSPAPAAPAAPTVSAAPVVTTPSVGATTAASTSASATSEATPAGLKLPELKLPFLAAGEPGTGSSDVALESDGWAYTAAALNPLNQRLYALSLAAKGKPAGHLLRIDPQTGLVADLGLATLDDVAKTPLPAKLDTATFTSQGHLVLSADLSHNDAQYFVLDLSKDEAATPLAGAPAFTRKSVTTEVKPGEFTAPQSWAGTSERADSDGIYLYSYAKTKAGAPALWTLNMETDVLSATTLKVRPGVDAKAASAIEETVYAFTKDTDVIVAGDREGNTVEVNPSQWKLGPGDELVATFKQPEADTLNGVLGLEAKQVAPITLRTTFHASQVSPVPSASEPSSVSSAAAEPSNAVNEPSVAAEPATDPEAPQPPRNLIVTVVDGAKAKSGVELQIFGTSVTATTNKDGVAVLAVPEGLKGDLTVTTAEGQRVKVAPADTTVRLDLAGATSATSTTSTTTTTTPTSAAPEAKRQVTLSVTAGDEDVSGLIVEDSDGNVLGKTDEAGQAILTLPANTAKAVRLRNAPKGYQTRSISIGKNDANATMTLRKATTTTTKSKPEEILDIIKQVDPLIKSLGAASALGGIAGAGKSTSTTRTTTSTSSTFRNTNQSGTVSTGRTTSASSTAKVTSTRKASKSTTSSSKRDGDLADTGTPMTNVIGLGLLFFLIGGAYVFMGRRQQD